MGKKASFIANFLLKNRVFSLVFSEPDRGLEHKYPAGHLSLLRHRCSKILFALTSSGLVDNNCRVFF
jgi:hypothetical protein